MSESGGKRTITLTALFTPPAAKPLLNQLLAVRGQDIEINAADVEQASTQAIQVLLAASEAWLADGKSFAVAAASEQFAEAVSLLGLTRELLPSGFELQ